MFTSKVIILQLFGSQVGDTLMLYLLRNTSIFLPLPQKSHHQVAGFPINDLCPRFSGHLYCLKHRHLVEQLFYSYYSTLQTNSLHENANIKACLCRRIYV